MKPFSESCARNQTPILEVLRRHFHTACRVLEIGSGSGQHAVHFAAGLPQLVWQPSDRPQHLDGIGQWVEEAALPNLQPPLALWAEAGRGLVSRSAQEFAQLRGSGFDAAFTANTLHIMGWPQVQALFGSLGGILQPGTATVAVYGPFNYRGEYTSASNREFDHMLRARDPASGIRDFEAVDALARAAGFRLAEDAAMPANNRTLVWRRA